MIEDLAQSSSEIATYSFAGATAAGAAETADDCKTSIKTVACLGGIAATLISAGAAKVTEEEVSKIVGKKLAKKIAGPAARLVSAQLDTIFSDLREARCR